MNKKSLARFGKKSVKFLNTQFALIVIAFFVLSLNVISAPVSYDANLVNPLINYDPHYVAETNRSIQPYVPIINTANSDEVADQVLSAVIGPDTTYVPKPMLVETIDHQTADRIRRGLRKEIVNHTVAQGETLSKIGAHYGVNVATLLEANDLEAADIAKIRPGDSLVIPPENTSNSLAWLDELHRAEREAREKREAERLAQIAKNNRARSSGTGLIARASASGEPDAAASGGRFISPAGGRDCYNGYHSYAIDCRGPIGAPIYASAGGTVIRVARGGWNGGYGNHVVIDHGNGWQTLYAHLNTINVEPGERVSGGQVIAGNGNTGRSTGPHVHLEIHHGGQRLNPCRYVSC